MERSGCSHRVKSEQLKESRDDGMRCEAGAMIKKKTKLKGWMVVRGKNKCF